MSASELEASLRNLVLEPFTANTLTSRRSLKAALAETANRGWAIDDEEHLAGVRCIAAAIRNEEGRIVGAISSAGPAMRLGDDRLLGTADVVCAAAASISADLGYAPRLVRSASR
jgi:DNA-binding IclR family transcriptional regulator